MPKVLISYRRKDVDPTVYRIHDTLVRRYGEKSVFIDVDNMPYGKDFREHIKEVLSEIDVLLAIIGPKWLDEVRRRNDEQKIDYVRLEIEAALKRNIPVIPVLVQPAEMPDASQIPASLEKLAFLHAAEVDIGRDFTVHVERLLNRVDEILGHKVKQEDGPKGDVGLSKKVIEKSSVNVVFRPEARLAFFLILSSIGLLFIAGSYDKFPPDTVSEVQGYLAGQFLIFFAIAGLSSKTRWLSFAFGVAIFLIAFWGVLAFQHQVDIEQPYYGYVIDQSASLLALFIPFVVSIAFMLYDGRRNGVIVDKLQKDQTAALPRASFESLATVPLDPAVNHDELQTLPKRKTDKSAAD